ncbi:hypothetical protein [Tenacibaculum sp. SZ-18]|uniref:hypothetical protein n=1 Tax=Tenacibaculum sp. SZ-18 TaxID=754423 RepID=UPI000C2CEF2C|nr:hypothetical protein [Tenacibaculum sp. SZ-18]
MSLQVTQKNGALHLKGRINTSTSRLFIIYLEHYAEKLKNVVINIDKVKEIDRDGIEAIKTVWAIALKKNKKFSIRGLGCKDIYDHFGTPFVA